PLARLDKPRLLERVRRIQALGTTPIAHSLRQVARDFGGAAGEKIVILVTDGKEECGGSPAAAVAELVGQGLKVRVDVVGLALEDAATKREMRRVAELTAGRFFDAGDGAALRDAIEQALAVPYEVFNAAGAKVAGGLVGRDAVAVPEGTYSVVVNAPGQSVTVRDVQVAPSRSTTIQLQRDGDRIQAAVQGP
ncbi:MAG TPA: vWA domain-containing protein, partial [Methylomirabilota bacterium]|nr:vWA domain-containing protein [Methylomirabilota bacterium]